MRNLHPVGAGLADSPAASSGRADSEPALRRRATRHKREDARSGIAAQALLRVQYSLH
jgi:hypothetical protein